MKDANEMRGRVDEFLKSGIRYQLWLQAVVISISIYIKTVAVQSGSVWCTHLVYTSGVEIWFRNLVPLIADRL